MTMLDRDEELKLLAFLASLAGLLGVVVSASNFQIGSASSTTVRAYFSVILVSSCSRQRLPISVPSATGMLEGSIRPSSAFSPPY